MGVAETCVGVSSSTLVELVSIPPLLLVEQKETKRGKSRRVLPPFLFPGLRNPLSHSDIAPSAAGA